MVKSKEERIKDTTAGMFLKGMIRPFIPRDLEMGIIMGLINYNGNRGSDRWLTMKEILSNNNFFKSQKTNFPRYIKRLEEERVVESSEKANIGRYRTTHAKIWRLDMSYKTLITVFSWCLSFDLERIKNNQAQIYSQHFFESDYLKMLPDSIKDRYRKTVLEDSLFEPLCVTPFDTHKTHKEKKTLNLKAINLS